MRVRELTVALAELDEAIEHYIEHSAPGRARVRGARQMRSGRRSGHAPRRRPPPAGASWVRARLGSDGDAVWAAGSVPRDGRAVPDARARTAGGHSNAAGAPGRRDRARPRAPRHRERIRCSPRPAFRGHRHDARRPACSDRRAWRNTWPRSLPRRYRWRCRPVDRLGAAGLKADLDRYAALHLRTYSEPSMQ